ncbi:MAG: alcohol dehydrogenase catalytic domain-containing protein [Rhodobiaceae bacterium]|nr:alcohol dehydrogenase catalytic domain-containing protein [Rhodobiaceae bacterium]
MRQLTFVSPLNFEWRDVPEPKVDDPRDAIIEPLAVVRCDLDLYIANGIFPVSGEFALGHETVGRVRDLGNAVGHVAIGDVVVFPFQVSCGRCVRCKRGHTSGCKEVPFRSNFGLGGINGHDWGGAFSDLMRVPFADHMLLKVPDNGDFGALAGAADNVSDGYRAVAPHLERFPGADVLIVGGLAQGVGLYATQVAKILTEGRVVYADDDPSRLALAAQMGAETCTLSGDWRDMNCGLFPITVEASSTQSGLTFALQSTEPGGVCTCVAGGVEPDHIIPRMEMYARGVTLDVSRANVHSVLGSVVEKICCGDLTPKAIAPPAYKFEDAHELFGAPDVKQVYLK